MTWQGQRYDPLSHLMHAQLSWISYRSVLKQVPDVMRFCPYLYVVLPVNKGLRFEIPLGLSALF